MKSKRAINTIIGQTCPYVVLIALFFVFMARDSHQRKGEKTMALTRKFLRAKGIEEEVIDEIIEAHSATVEALKEERDGYKEEANKVTELQEAIKAAKEEASQQADKNPYKVKYDALKDEFEAYKKGEAEKATKASKKEAYKALLKECGIADKRIDAVTKVADLDSLELDDSGNIKNASELKASIKEEWSEFIPTDSKAGAKTATPPAQSKGKEKLTKEQIMDIKDTTQRQEAWAQYLTEQNEGGN